MSMLSREYAFRPRAVKWSSLCLLNDVTTDQITAAPELRQKVHHDLWGDMCAEYDAENLWRYLQESGGQHSYRFNRCLDEWRADERNHYLGLRLICSMMYGLTEGEIDAQLAARTPDFSGIESFLTDELRTCVVLAYDEFVSACGYQAFLPEFRQFGPVAFAQWVQRAARDEWLHYNNFLDVLYLEHTQSPTVVSAILDEICAYESKPEMRYYATFLLDHTEETFSRQFLGNCSQHVAHDFEHLCSGGPKTPFKRKLNNEIAKAAIIER